MTDRRAWRPILFICPRTLHTVQGTLPEEAYKSTSESKDHYEPVSCIACLETHFVNPATGAVLGDKARQR